MLVDSYYPRGERGEAIYWRYRNPNGELIEGTDHTFRHYFYSECDAKHPHVHAYAVDRFPLTKHELTTPNELYDERAKYPKTWEADVPFTDRWLIDNHPTMPAWTPRKCYFDIEWNPDDNNDFTQCWAAIDNFTQEQVCFAWREGQTEYEVERRHTGSPPLRPYDEYILHIYTSEEALHEAVIQYIEEKDFDMLIAHAAMWADIPHMVRRFKNYKRLSPLGQVRKVKDGHDGYRYNDQPIKGRWVFDTACKASDGSGFERVWKDSGNGQFPSRKLDAIGKHLELGGKDEVDLSNDWYDNFYRLTDYCMQDVRLMYDIDMFLNCTEFFTNMVRFCGVSLTSTFEVGNFARGLVCRRTDLKFPTRDRSRRREKGQLQGADVMDPVAGLHDGVAVLDFKGLYPSIMLGNNLCWTTRRDEPSETTRTMLNGTHWEQEEQGILPSVIEYLFEERQKLKDSGDRILEKAVKRVMASLYGLCAESLGHGMADLAIADTILSEGRRAIGSLRDHAYEMGYEVLFGHTDSVFIRCPLDEMEQVSQIVTDIIQHETGNYKLFAEAEAWMPHWFCGDVKNRYAGIIQWPESDAGKLKVSGFEMKHSSTPKAIRELQKGVLMLVADGASEVDVTQFVRSWVNQIRKHEIPLDELSYSTRLSKQIEATETSSHSPKRHYPTTAGGYARAARYYNWYMEPDEPFIEGDSVLWCYVSDVPHGMPATKVVGCRSISELDGFTFDTEGIIDKLVRKKLKLVFDVLDWDLGMAVDKHRPKKLW